MAASDSQPITGVISLSGGFDSTANLALALEQGHSIVRAITFDYGQHAARSEIRAAGRLCEYYGLAHQVIPLHFMREVGNSTLLSDEASIPTLKSNQLDDLNYTQDSAKKVWVPNRNGMFLSLCAAVAEGLGASVVWVGFNVEEAATFPDNSEAFLQAINHSLNYSTANQVKVRCLTTALDKRQIARAVNQLAKPFPWDLVWSCYHSGDQICGACESCMRFNRARQG